MNVRMDVTVKTKKVFNKKGWEMFRLGMVAYWGYYFSLTTFTYICHKVKGYINTEKAEGLSSLLLM